MSSPKGKSIEFGDPLKAWNWLAHLPPEVAERIRAGDQFTARINLSPEMAQDCLDSMHENYRLKIADVRALTRAIEAGKYEPTAIPMQFAPDGRLWDGQKRCHSCLAAKRTILAQMAFNEPRNRGPVGQRPTIAEQLEVELHLSNGALHAAVARMLWLDDLGYPPTGVSGLSPQFWEIVETLSTHSLVKGSIKAVAKRRAPAGVAPSHSAWMHYKICRYSRERADAFVAAVLDPLSVTGDPLLRDNALALREHLEREVRRITRRAPRSARLAWLVDTWNATTAGRAVTQFRIPKVMPKFMAPPAGE